MNYCAKQERSHYDVEQKLVSYGYYGEQAEQIIVYLIENNFLNEERYAKWYVRSKFNQNSWGRNKIKQGLREKNISGYCLKLGLDELDLPAYNKKATDLIQRKKEGLIGHKLEVKQKVFRYMVSKGYEYQLIKDIYQNLYD